MKKLTVFLTTLLLIIIQSSIINNQLKAQDNVGIGTNTPDSYAILDLTATDKGLLIPRLTTAQRTSMSLGFFQIGLLVFDTGDQQFWYWDGGQWVTIGGGGGGCVTLDEAYDCGGAGVGRIITSDNGPVEINYTTAWGGEICGLKVYSSVGTPTTAIETGNTTNGPAIVAQTTNINNQYATIEAHQSSNFGTAANFVACIAGTYEGSNNSAVGVAGMVDNIAGGGQAGIYGLNYRTDGGFGVLGNAYNGVVGFTDKGQGYGVWGENSSPGVIYNNIGVCGTGYVGVWGQTTSGGFGVYSMGDLLATGLKFFNIDHPLDPENKYLRHFCIESPEVLNLYRGTVVLDENGQAVVELPDYFESININFSYNLTPIGNSAPNLYIKQEINNAKFQIAGGLPGMKVSWVVYAQRNDLYVQKNPERLNPEPVKKDSEKGKYLMPELYDQPESKSIHQLKSVKTSTQTQLNILK